MAKRRDTLTAVLFLAGLLTGAVFLLFGLFAKPGFDDPSRPNHFTRRTKATVIHQTELGRKPLERSKHDPGSASKPTYIRPRRKDPGPAVRALDRVIVNSAKTPAVTLDDGVRAVESFIDSAQPALNELLDREHTFIQLYGGIQSLAGRRVIEDMDPQYTVVKLTDHLLTFVDMDAQRQDMTERAEEMVEFARRVKREYRVPLLYVQAPSKLNMAQLPEGISDYSDEEADQFLAILEENRIDTLDLRPVFRQAAENDPLAVEECFFHTDHHWTPAGAFLGYQTLCEKLEKDYRFELEKEWTDKRQFDRYVFKDAFLGSQGRRVGSLYVGLDDFEIWSPKFSTNFTYTVPLSGVKREGPFAVSLLFPERLSETGYYETNQYTIYAGGDYLLSRAYNEQNPDGKRILILRDSFGCALTPFLSIVSGEVMAMDPRQFNGSQDTMLSYVDWLKPDLIIVMNSTGSLEVDKLFPYLPSAYEAIQAEKDAARTEKATSEK